jgi:hypothetical protein
MKCMVALAALLAATLAASSPACAWAPDADVDHIDPPDGGGWVPTAEPVAPPDGIYLVSETYVDDVVSHDGPVTSYSTETVHEITGSYARVLESVPTGAQSGYDGSAFNGRAALTDGRAVAGTYYENYIRTDDGFVAVSVVFFQDDLEIARANEVAAQAPAPPGRPAPAAEGPATPAPVAEGPATPAPVAPPVAQVSPRVDDAPSNRNDGPAGPADHGSPPPLPDVTIEVLRARRVAIPFVYPGAVRWRFVSGEGVALGGLTGGRTDRFVARWDRLAIVGNAWVDRFQLDFADGTTRELVLRIVVRSPGLVE